MTHNPPPPREGSSLNAIWFILGGLVVLAVLYFAFFSAGPITGTPAGGNTNVNVETPAASSAPNAAGPTDTPVTPTPAEPDAAPAAATPAPATPAPAAATPTPSTTPEPAPATPAPAN